jgi:Caspase domain
MNRHALLIGSQILGLLGPHHDVAAMAVVLSRRGFEITQCIEAKATRGEILAAYRALIHRARPGDAVVVYYSGHGGYAEDPTGRRVQYLLPTDWVEDEDTFHGILDAELADLLAQLTGATTNVTVILDCCHASLLSRGPAAAVPAEISARVVPSKWTQGLAAHVARAPVRAHIAGNPHAVRLVATEADREAFEADQHIDGMWVRRGLFTRALERVLEEPGADALSWRGVCHRVREQVLARARTQRPGVEGPADRTLFTTSEATRPDAVVYFEHDGDPALRASRILGARVGIEYDIVRRGETAVTPASRVATATISALEGSAARVVLSDVTESPEVGSLAFPRQSPFPAMPVALIGRDHPMLRDQVLASTLVDLVTPELARFVVETVDRALVLTDHGELPTYALRMTDDASGRILVMRWIGRWAKAEALRALPPGGLADDALELSWGHASAGKLVTRGPGDPFRVGERICLYAKNTTRQPLYMWIIDIGVDGEVTLVSGVVEGQAIQPGATLAIGEDRGVPVGLELTWPADLGREIGPRRESLVVLAADHWVDVSVFETPALHVHGKGQASQLEDLLRSLGAGTPRDLGPQRAVQAYGVARVDFDLDPRPAT